MKMRVIKFRAWDEKAKKIFPVHKMNFCKIRNTLDSYFGVDIHDKDSDWQGDVSYGGSVLKKTGKPGERQLPRYELMQYTDLKDKNGTEIYEGDIVKLIKPDSRYVIKGDGYEDVGNDEGFEVTGEVKFLYSCWFIDEGDERGLPLDFDENQMLEIIGNVFEHPDLLEVAE